MLTFADTDARRTLHPEEQAEVARLWAHGTPGVIVPPAFEEAFYQGGNLPEQLVRLFAPIRPARIDARRPRPSSTASFASLTSPSAPTWCVTIDGRRPRLMGARARGGARADRAHPLLLPQADARVLAFMLEQNRPHGAQV